MVWEKPSVSSPVYHPRPTQPIPFVPSPMDVVARMLELANLEPGMRLLDLGCGDGRVILSAAKSYSCRSLGVEASRGLIEYVRRRASLERLGEGEVRVVRGNLFEASLEPTDVVTLYLTPEALRILRPRLGSELRPGASIVSHNYAIHGWKPKAVEELLSREDGKIHRVYLYKVPWSIPRVKPTSRLGSPSRRAGLSRYR